MARNLMLTLPPWRNEQKTRDNWQAGPWDRLIQARGLGALGTKSQALPQVLTGTVEDHF
jgi:hypothetical protein